GRSSGGLRTIGAVAALGFVTGPKETQTMSEPVESLNTNGADCLTRLVSSMFARSPGASKTRSDWLSGDGTRRPAGAAAVAMAWGDLSILAALSISITAFVAAGLSSRLIPNSRITSPAATTPPVPRHVTGNPGVSSARSYHQPCKAL